MVRFGGTGFPVATGSKVWTTQADFLTTTAANNTDLYATANSVVLGRGMITDGFLATDDTFPTAAWWNNAGTNPNTYIKIKSNKLYTPIDKTTTVNLYFLNTPTSTTFTLQFDYQCVGLGDANYLDGIAWYFIARNGNAVRILYEPRNNRIRLYDDGTGGLATATSVGINNTSNHTIRIRCDATGGHIYIDVDTINKIDYTVSGTLTNSIPYLQQYASAGAKSQESYIDTLYHYNGVTVAYPYSASGTVNFQYDTGNTGTFYFNSYSFTATKPANTNVRVRFRSAATQGGLATASWTMYNTATTDNMNLPSSNRWIEAQLELSSTDTTATPQVDDLTVNWSTTANSSVRMT